MPKEFKRYHTKNGNKYIRYYTPEGENSAFAQHDGATRRAIESKASLIAAAKVGRALELYLRGRMRTMKIEFHLDPIAPGSSSAGSR